MLPLEDKNWCSLLESFSFNLVTDRKIQAGVKNLPLHLNKNHVLKNLVCRVSLDVAGLTLYISIIYIHEVTLKCAVDSGSLRKQLFFLHSKKYIDLNMVK